MRLGVIGTGNMARAILTGILDKGVLRADQIIAADAYAPSREKAQKEFDIEVTEDNKKVAACSDNILLSVKPQFYVDVINEIKDSVAPNTLVITIAPGKSLQWLEEQFGKDVRIIRCMPNTPAMVGEGMTALCPNEKATVGDIRFTKELLHSFGRFEIVDEHLMDTVTAVSGSSPAYVFMMIEAMADAAVAGGMARPIAYEFAAQAVMGSAKMVLETGKHPGELKDMVCSPGGTTIEAVKILEERGFRSALIDAIEVCRQKSMSM